MKIIEKLSEMMEEEIKDADKYIECAMKWKEDDVMLSKMFADLSMDELKHAMLIHDHTTRLITEYKSKGNEPPAEMLAVYNYLHEKHLEKFNAIKVKQTVYRGQ